MERCAGEGNGRRFSRPLRAKSGVQDGGGSLEEEEGMDGIPFSRNREAQAAYWTVQTPQPLGRWMPLCLE